MKLLWFRSLLFLILCPCLSEAGTLLCNLLRCSNACSKKFRPLCKLFRCCDSGASPADCSDLPTFEDSPVCDADILYDVLIVGSGWAGIGAAREIENYNNVVRVPSGKEALTYCIVEAATFMGGRSTAAHWIHGGVNNPILQLFRELGNDIDYTVTDYNDVNFYECDDIENCSTVSSIDSQDADLVALLAEFIAAKDCVYNKSEAFHAAPADPGQVYTLGTPLRDLFLDCNWTDFPDDGDVASILEWFYIDFEFGQTPNNTTIDGYPLGPEDFGGRDFQDLFVNDPSSCRPIAIAVADGSGICGNIELCTEAYMIDWSSDPVTVETRCSCCESAGTTKTLQAKKVISTVSVGVLDRRGDNTYGERMFEPPLPQTKLNGMRNYFNMIEYMELTFQFSDAYWDAGPWEASQFIGVETPERGRCNIWQTLETENADEFFPGSHAIVCTILTEVILELAPDGYSLGEARNFIAHSITGPPIVNELLQNTLGKIEDLPECGWENPYIWDPEVNGTTPSNGDCGYKTYPTNRWWQGSYANSLPTATSPGFDAYVEPLRPLLGTEPTLFFAGAATCDRQWGYQHGAYWSGIKEANAIIDLFEGTANANTNATPQYCDVPPP